MLAKQRWPAANHGKVRMTAVSTARKHHHSQLPPRLTASELLLSAGRWAGIFSVFCSSSSVCNLASNPTAGMQDRRRQRLKLWCWWAVTLLDLVSSCACCRCVACFFLRPRKGSGGSPWGRWAQIPALTGNTDLHDFLGHVIVKASGALIWGALQCWRQTRCQKAAACSRLRYLAD